MGATMTGTVHPETRPLLLVIEADPSMLVRIEGELQRAFGSDFRVRGELTAADGSKVLRRAHEQDQRVALALVDQAIEADERAALLGDARRLHPDARRALLIGWGAWADRATASAILQAIAVGDISYYVLKPWINRDEFFHRVVAEFVQEWSRNETANYCEVVVVADRHSARARTINRLLDRNGIPHAFRARGSDLADLVLKTLPAEAADAQVLVWMPAVGGTLLLDPTDAEVVEGWGIPTTLSEEDRDFDVLVIGAGRRGLPRPSMPRRKVCAR